MSVVSQRNTRKVLETEWVSDAQRHAMEVADLDAEVADHNRRAYERLEKEDKQAAINEQIADQVYDQIKKSKGLIKKQLRKKIAEQVVLAGMEASGADVDPEALLSPEQLMLLVGEAGMMIDQLDQQQ